MRKTIYAVRFSCIDITVYHIERAAMAQKPRGALSCKNCSLHCLDCHSVCDNIYCLLTMFSALAAVCTLYCAIEIVFITLHTLVTVATHEHGKQAVSMSRPITCIIATFCGVKL